MKTEHGVEFRNRRKGEVFKEVILESAESLNGVKELNEEFIRRGSVWLNQHFTGKIKKKSFTCGCRVESIKVQGTKQ